MISHYPFYQNPLLTNPQPQQHDERIWVQNETAAEAYLVAPNSFVRLWNASEPVFYEKRADASGRPYPMETFGYKRRQAPQPLMEQSMPNDIDERFEALTKRIEALEAPKKGVKTNAKQSNADDTSVQSV